MSFVANNDSFALLSLLGSGALFDATGSGTARSMNMANVRLQARPDKRAGGLYELRLLRAK